MYHPPSLYGTFLTRDSPVTPDVADGSDSARLGWERTARATDQATTAVSVLIRLVVTGQKSPAGGVG